MIPIETTHTARATTTPVTLQQKVIKTLVRKGTKGSIPQHLQIPLRILIPIRVTVTHQHSCQQTDPLADLARRKRREEIRDLAAGAGADREV